jgi:hypothetical protein
VYGGADACRGPTVPRWGDGPGFAVYGRAPAFVDIDPLSAFQPRSSGLGVVVGLGRGRGTERAMTGRISPEIWLSGTRPCCGATGNADQRLASDGEESRERSSGQRGSAHCCGGHSRSVVGRDAPVEPPRDWSKRDRSKRDWSKWWRPVDSLSATDRLSGAVRGRAESYQYASLPSPVHAISGAPCSYGESSVRMRSAWSCHGYDTCPSRPGRLDRSL